MSKVQKKKKPGKKKPVARKPVGKVQKDIKDTPLPEGSRQVDLKPGQGILDEAGQKCLSEVDLLKVENLRLKAMERKTAAQALHVKAEQVEFNATLTARALRDEALAAEKEVEALRRQQEKLFIEFGPKYGIDFKQATYDDESGIITIFEEETT